MSKPALTNSRIMNVGIAWTVPCFALSFALIGCGGTDSARAPQPDAGDAGEVPPDEPDAPVSDAGPRPEPEPARPEPEPEPATRDAALPSPIADAGNPVEAADASLPTPIDAGLLPEPEVADASVSLDAGIVEPFDAALPSIEDAGASAEAGAPPPLGITTEFAIGGAQCGVAYNGESDQVWLYPCSGVELLSYDSSGQPVSAIPRPGEAANDVDVDVASVAFAVAGVEVPVGTLLFSNGESDTVEIYAVDPVSGTVLTTLETAFGASHVVGAAYHPALDAFFAVQDRVPGATDGNLVGMLSPADGALLSSWSVLPNFDVNYGDLDVCLSTGNLMLVSSNETSIAEFTTDGAFVGAHELPIGVGGLSGIALDDASGRVWVVSNSGGVWSFDGGPCAPR
jgi:hypothetical protein